MPTHLILIRHGETEWNKSLRIQGHEDVPLSRAGEEQAKLLGRRLKTLDLDAAYTSDLSRSARTAELALAGLKLPLVSAPELRERCFGRWQGLLWPEVEKDFPTEAKAFHADPFQFAPPEGETWNQMQSRVFQKVEEAAARHPNQTVALFTHGGPCKAAIFAALGLPPAQSRLWGVSNASIHRLARGEPPRGSGRSPWTLVSFNDTAHLDKFISPSAIETAL